MNTFQAHKLSPTGEPGHPISPEEALAEEVFYVISDVMPMRSALVKSVEGKQEWEVFALREDSGNQKVGWIEKSPGEGAHQNGYQGWLDPALYIETEETKRRKQDSTLPGAAARLAFDGYIGE